MIARNSKSYPYLAIAQHYDIPYGEVLRFSDMLKDCEAEVVIGLEWQEKVYEVYYEQLNSKT